MKKTFSFLKILVLAAFFILAGFVLYFLWGARGGNESYVEMACGFEGREVNCMDSVPAWNEGLAFYDSSLATTRDTLETLKQLLWGYWNIEFAGAGESAVTESAILPLKVLENRKSGCMGLAWLAMMVAEARNIPLKVILLPGHVFLRYGASENSKSQGVNLEPNRRGFSYTDDEYREKYKGGHWTGFEFKPLTSSQFMGLAAFDLGNVYLKCDPRHALVWYRVAEEFFPAYEGIKVNQEYAKKNF